MTHKRFHLLYKTAKWSIALFIPLCFLLLGDFIVEGGLPYLCFALFLVIAGLMLPLIFCRCTSCRKSLAWISTHKNFDDQPDPETLENCPNCGEPFFDQPKLES